MNRWPVARGGQTAESFKKLFVCWVCEIFEGHITYVMPLFEKKYFQFQGNCVGEAEWQIYGF